MGTRHLTMVVQNGVHKVAQYGQWDGYPSCAGAHILESLQRAHDEDFADFEEKVRTASFISAEDIQQRWRDAGADDSGWVDTNVTATFKKNWPQLSRDMGYDIIEFILDSAPGLELQDRSTFAGDSLFCEWAYVIDLDQRTFEVFEGLNKTSLCEGDRFVHLTREGEEYAPVMLHTSFSLDDLPNAEEFQKKFKEDC